MLSHKYCFTLVKSLAQSIGKRIFNLISQLSVFAEVELFFLHKFSEVQTLRKDRLGYVLDFFFSDLFKFITASWLLFLKLGIDFVFFICT